jgi:hypothetical protein
VIRAGKFEMAGVIHPASVINGRRASCRQASTAGVIPAGKTDTAGVILPTKPIRPA